MDAPGRAGGLMKTERRTIVVERISYTVFAIDGGRLLKTWARVGTKLKAVTATTEKRLREKLRPLSVKLLNGDIEGAELENSDNRIYVAAREALEPLGVSVDVAAREYAAARKVLGAVSLTEAVNFFRLHSGEISAKPITMTALADIFVASIARRSDAYKKVFGQDLARLKRELGAELISDITVEKLEKFMAGVGHKVGDKFQPAGDWRRKQVRSELVTLFNFARQRKYLPQKLDHVAQSLVTEETVSDARDVWDPDHLRAALVATLRTEPQWVPWLAFSAFANVRSVPIRRLTWENVHWADNLLELPARSSKVRKRITVPIRPALLSWLSAVRNSIGPMFPDDKHSRFTGRLKSTHGLPYYPNVLRRSYITYLLAETDDEDHVARVANTSVEKLRDNYRQIRTTSGKLVTKDLAKAWFEVSRNQPANVIPLPASAAGQVTTR